MQEELEEENELYEHYRFEVDPKQSKLRVDKFLSIRLPASISRNKIQEAIKHDFILVNGKSTKANYKVSPNDTITLSLPQAPRNGEIEPQNIPLKIIFEDEHLIVIDKEAGMVVHPAHKNWDNTLVNALLYHFQHLPHAKGNEYRAGLVHRIDKDTSGILVVAKSEEALMQLAKQFFHHTIQRTYLALVWSEPPANKGTIDAPLGRSPKDRRVVMVYPHDDQNAKRAVTHYEVLKNFHYVSLVKCQLETGRTHQIRAHFKSLGCPIFSDEMYGGNRIVKGQVFSKYKAFVENCFEIMPRQALHAQSLGFEHPITGEKLFFESPLPKDFEVVLEKWENYLKNRVLEES